MKKISIRNIERGSDTNQVIDKEEERGEIFLKGKAYVIMKAIGH